MYKPATLLMSLYLAILIVAAVPVQQNDVPDGVIAFSLKPQTAPTDLKHNNTIFRRDTVDDTVWSNLEQKVIYYALNIDIGTPGQTVSPLVDTGSSDLWVYTPVANVKNQTSYDPSKSSTYKYIDDKFSITYVKGAASGNFVTDNIAFQGVTVKDQKFATIDKDENGPPVLGISFSNSEANVNTEGEYSNLPKSLVEQGFIKTNAYSLYLNQVDLKSDGELLFGGVDTSKYTGDLYTVPVTSDRAFYVKVDSFDGYTNSFDAVLDSGTSLTYLPPDLYDYIVSKYNLEPNTLGVYSTDTLPEDILELTFSGATFKIPLSSFFVLSEYVLKEPYNKLVSKYTFVLQPNTGSQNITIFGDIILQALYLVYDLDGKEISIGQANHFAGSPSIVAIPGPNRVPGAKKAPNY